MEESKLEMIAKYYEFLRFKVVEESLKRDNAPYGLAYRKGALHMLEKLIKEMREVKKVTKYNPITGLNIVSGK